MEILFLIILLFLVLGFISARSEINRISSMTSEQISEEEQQIKEAKEQKRKARQAKRQSRQDPTATTLRNIYWLTFFNTFFKKK